MRKTVQKHFCLSIGIAYKLETLAQRAGITEKEWITNVIMNWEIYDTAHKKPFLISGSSAKSLKFNDPINPDDSSNSNDSSDEEEEEKPKKEKEKTPEQLEKEVRREERRIAQLKREGKYVPPFEERFGVDWRVQNGNANVRVSGQIIEFKDVEYRDAWIKSFKVGHRYQVITSREQYAEVLKEIKELKELDIDPDPYATAYKKANPSKSIDLDEELEKFSKKRKEESDRIMAERKRKGITGNPRLANLSPEELRELNKQVRLGEKKYRKELKEEKKRLKETKNAE